MGAGQVLVSSEPQLPYLCSGTVIASTSQGYSEKKDSFIVPSSAWGGGNSTIATLGIFSGGLGVSVWNFSGSGERLDHLEPEHP